MDEVIKEPLGGANRDHQAAAKAVQKALSAQLKTLQSLSTEDLLQQRYERLMSFGNVDIK